MEGFLENCYAQREARLAYFADSVFSKGNVLVRAMMTAGAAVRHPEAFVKVTVED